MTPNFTDFRFARRYCGGGGAAAAPVVPNPTPPITPDNPATVSVEQATRRAQLNRSSISKTTMAGMTGGWTPPAASIPGGAPQTGSGPNAGAGRTKTG